MHLGVRVSTLSLGAACFPVPTVASTLPLLPELAWRPMSTATRRTMCSQVGVPCKLGESLCF